MGGAGGAPQLGCGAEGVTCVDEAFFGDCTASADRKVKWEFLSYETVIPSDARILFYVRTAATEDELSSATFKLAGTAEMGAETVIPSAPILLVDVLDTGHDGRDWMELRRTLVDSTDGQTPSVTDYVIQFSCVEF